VNDRPTSVELLRVVERFLQKDVVPALSGPQRYHARVAANVVAIVAREIETEEAQLRGEWERLGRLLNLDEERPDAREALRADVGARSEALVQRIRAGDADAGRWRDDVLAHLRRTVADKLDVARPPRVD
jgi:predicted NBD/HSP70 family sugar kinase